MVVNHKLLYKKVIVLLLFVMFGVQNLYSFYENDRIAPSEI